MSIINKFRSNILCVLLGCTVLPVTAQTDSTEVSNAELRQTIDSLSQTVTELKKEQAAIKREMFLNKVWGRKSLFGVSWITTQTLTDKGTGDKWKLDYAVGMQWGKTYYMHSKPIAGRIKIGIDVNWIDLSFAQYKDPLEDLKNTEEVKTRNNWYDDFYGEEEECDEEIDFGLQQIDLGVAIGPSITYNPVGHLKIAAYFHYIPTMSATLLNSEASTGYVGNMSLGMTVSHKSLYIGFESRWGTGKYSQFDAEDFESDFESEGDYEDSEVPELGSLFKDKHKMKTTSFRLTVGFRW